MANEVNLHLYSAMLVVEVNALFIIQ